MRHATDLESSPQRTRGGRGYPRDATVAEGWRACADCTKAGDRRLRPTVARPPRSVLSGIRLATFDAPTAHNGAANTGSGSCSQVGYHIDFTPVELRERYGSQQNYIDQVARITRKATRDGFLVSADADRTIEEAKTVKF
jgi:hypothetical protein